MEDILALLDSNIHFAAFQELRHELYLISLRTRRRFSPWQRRKASQLAQLRNVRLQFGCGSRVLPGWGNLDVYSYADDEITTEIDLQGKLPLFGWLGAMDLYRACSRASRS